MYKTYMQPQPQTHRKSITFCVKKFRVNIIFVAYKSALHKKFCVPHIRHIIAMYSQITMSKDGGVEAIDFCILGYCMYIDIGKEIQRQLLETLLCRREADDTQDRCAVMVKNGETVIECLPAFSASQVARAIAQEDGEAESDPTCTNPSCANYAFKAIRAIVPCTYWQQKNKDIQSEVLYLQDAWINEWH